MNVKRILAPIDFSPRSREGLRWAVTIAWSAQAGLHTLHVVSPGAADADLKEKSRDWGSMRAEIATHSYLLVEEICRELSIAGLEHREHVTLGEAVDEIFGTVIRERINLIVIAAHGLSDASDALMGSVAEKVVRFSPVPVFSLSRAAISVAA
ncbi:MAG: universal stress protein [bacterium]